MEHPSVKNGVFGAVAAIIVYLVLWFVDPKGYLTYGSWIGIAIIIFFMYLAGKEARNINEGFINFGDIFKYLFITFVVLTLITTIFNYILMNFIDPSLIDLQKEIALEAVEKMADAFGNEEMMSEVEDQMDEQSFDLTPWKAIQGWLFGLILGAIIAGIQGAIMKKKDPNFSEFA